MTEPAAGGSADAADRPGPQAHRPLDARLAVVAAGSWAVTVAGVWAGPAAATSAAAVCAGGGALATVTAARAARGRTRRRWSARRIAVTTTIAAVLLTSCGYAVAITVRVHAVEANPVHEVYGRTAHASMTVDDDPRPIGEAAFGGSRVLVHGTLDSLRLHGRDVPTGGSVVAFAPTGGWQGLLPGQNVDFRGRFAEPGRRDMSVATIEITGAPSDASAASWLGRAAGSVRHRFAGVCASVLAPPVAGLLRGLVLGDRSGMDADARDRFVASGLTHLTAVSGTHFALVCAIVLLLARPLGPRPAAVITAVVMIGYVVLVRPSPSVLRAASMGMIGLGALLTGRRRQALPALSATVLVLLGWRPALSVSAGFAMSALATAALVVLAPMWTDWLRARRWPVALAEAAAVAVAAHAATMPVVAGISGTLSMVAVPANLLAAPAVAPALLLGVLAAAIGPFWPWGAELLARCAGPPVWWLEHVARWCAALPGAQVAVPAGRLGAVLVLAAVAVVCAWFASRRFRWCAVAASAGAEVVWLPLHWTGPPW